MRSKVKYLTLLTQLLLVFLLVLNMKYLVLVIQSKKTDYNIKINKIEKKITVYNHNKHITSPEFSRFKADICALRLKRANLASKSDIANFVNKIDFYNKLKDVKSNKNELNELSKKIKALSTKGLKKNLIDKFSILIFIPAKKYINYFGGTTLIDLWKPNGMSEESIEIIIKSDRNFC